MTNLYFERILLVEDDTNLRRALSSPLLLYGAEVKSCASKSEALNIVQEWHPQLVLLDFKLTDGNSTTLLHELSTFSPFPIVIAMSAYAQAPDAFSLAQLGVRYFLSKPIDLATLENAICKAVQTKPDITPHIKNAVGHIGIKHLETDIRKTMMQEALSRTNGSRRGAAKILQVSRQFVQHVINKFNERSDNCFFD